MNTKRCTKCERVKPESSFYKKQYYCKLCQSKIRKQYRSRHKNKINKRQKLWRNANKDAIRIYNKKYKSDNQKSIHEKMRIWRAKNKIRLQHYDKKRNKEMVEFLSDVYVRCLLRMGSAIYLESIPKSLTDAKRAHIILRREINKLKSQTKTKP